MSLAGSVCRRQFVGVAVGLLAFVEQLKLYHCRDSFVCITYM